MERLTHFVYEVMRHSGFPGTLLNRVARQDHQLLGLQVYAGTTVTALVTANFHDDRLFPDSRRFDPSRFGDEGQRARMNGFAFLPFGAGPRSCVGKSLALVTVKAFLVALLRAYHFELPKGY
jgi:cytochrome P450